MKTLPIGRYRFFQSLQPLSLLTKITNQHRSGCLHVYSPSATWLFYLDEGKLIYACYADNMFKLIYRTLQRLSQQIPTLHNGIYRQLQAIFETGIEDQAIPNPDYLAICWLVNQKYISTTQVRILIEQLALEVLESFLKLQEGSYEFLTESFLDEMPKFCHLDLLLLVEQSQQRYENQHFSWTKASQPSPTKSQYPFTRPNNIPPRANTSNHSPQQIPRHNHSKKTYTIFCIDDSQIVLNTIKSFLDEQIFSFIGVKDPVKALMQILRVKPDIIFLDIEMPNLNGYELCSLLRKHSYFHDTPIIMATGRKGLIDKARAKIVKASGYLTKPFTQTDLLKIIFKHIE